MHTHPLLTQQALSFFTCSHPHLPQLAFLVPLAARIMLHSIEQERLAAHLKSLSKKELITLVMDFAPEHYRKQIELLHVSPERKEADFNKVKQKISRLNWGAYATYERIDQMLVAALTELRSYWKTRPEEVLTIYRDVAVSMHQAIESGGLYDRMEDVYMETGWPCEVLDFLAQLDEEQRQAAINELSTIRESLEWISAAYVVDAD